jgi:CelD/BcsL family acetyltransferase involved in cellulose biosynthesis
MLSLEIIRDLDRLGAIVSDWESLIQAIPGITPFQFPVWQLTWWKHFGSGELCVFAFWNGRELAGLVPCFLHQWNARRQITLMGSGISDYLEPPIRQEVASEVCGILREHLQRSEQWDICEWQDLNADSFLQELGLGGSLSVQADPDMCCTRINIPDDFDTFWSRRPKDLRRNLRRYSERARTLGVLEFKVTEAADCELFDALITLHAARWEERGELGMIAANSSATFLRHVAKEFATQGMLRFFTLRFKGKITAAIIAFPWRNKMFSYLSAFDPEHEHLGMGRTLLYEAIRHCARNEITDWDFLRGDEPYKFSWGAQSIPKLRLRIVPH